MSNELSCTFEEFKRQYQEFADALHTMSLPELDNSFKCIGLSYLNLSDDMWRSSAVIILNWATEKYLHRESELLAEEEI